MTRDVTSSEGDQKFSVKAHVGLLENGFLSRSNHIVVFFIIGVLKLRSKFLDLKGLYIITAVSLKFPPIPNTFSNFAELQLVLIKTCIFTSSYLSRTLLLWLTVFR